jgi:hypothetical protein
MIRQSYTAVIERNVTWQGEFATEPYEAAWASEAIFFLRALTAAEIPADAVARIQLSPDGIRWCDEGTVVSLPTAAEGLTFARVRHFGGWLRVAGRLPKGAQLTVIVALALKE